MQYSEAFKAKMVQKLADPRGPSATQLAREVGVHQSTLSRWLRQAGRVAEDRSVLLLSDHPRRTMPPKRPQDWTAEEKLAVVIEAATVPEEELGAFLRRKGLHEAQLAQWREAVLSGLEKPATRAKRSPEARRVRELERELARKDKALAEAAAILVLKKKAAAIWGDGDDDTPRKNGSGS